MKKLTDKEKEKLAKRYVDLLPNIVIKKNFELGFFLIFSGIILTGFVFAAIFKIAILAIILGILEVFPILINVSTNGWISDDIRAMLNGKMSVREFKLLLKSGELDRFINEQIVLKNQEIKSRNEEIKAFNEKFNPSEKEMLTKELKPRKIRKKKTLIQRACERLLERQEENSL